MNRLFFVLVFSLLLASPASSLAGTIVRFSTTVGDFDVELFDADKPATVQNFLRYVQGGNYTNMIMHRVVQGFVIQGGGYNVTNRATEHPSLEPVSTFPPITNEFSVGKFYSNVFGTIAMAKTSDPDSATSQFFFNLADNSAALDDTNNSGGFTVFGRVIAGTNILNSFNIGPGNKVVKLSNQGGSLTELPVVYSANPTNVSFDDLIYVDITASPAYTPMKATYNGLATAPSTSTLRTPGLVTLTTAANRKFTGSLRFGSTRFSLSGSFDTNGYAVARIGKINPLTVNLHLDSASAPERIVGSITTANGATTWTAYRAAFDGRIARATQYAGKYTLTIPGTDQAGFPAGDGFAAIAVDLAGKTKISGSLADGTAFNQVVALSKDGHCPLYASLSGGRGSLSGWVTFTNRADDVLNGSLLWLKPALATAKFYPAGFAYQTDATGVRYTPPTAGQSVLAATNYHLAFTGGNLAAPFTNNVTLTSANRLSNSQTLMIFSFTLPTGLFRGKILYPGTAVRISFQGAVRQSQGAASGYFLGASQSGRVSLEPAE